MIVGDNTITADGLGEFLKSVRKKYLMHRKRWQIFLKNSGRDLEVEANVGSPFACRIPKAALSTLPEMNIFCQIEKGLYLGSSV